MDYKTAAQTAIFQRVDNSQETIATTPVLLANLADKLFPDKLTVSTGTFYFMGSRLDGMSDLVPYLMVPGVRFVEPLYVSTPGTIPTKAFPKVVAKPFVAADLFGAYLDAEYKDFLDAVKHLWEKALGAGFFTLEQGMKIKTCIENGIAPVPVVADVYAKFYGTIPLQFRAPPLANESRAQAWTNICTAFSDAFKAYVKRDFKKATVLAQEAAANAKLWEDIYAGVEAVRDAPFTAASAVGSAFWEGIGTKWKVVLIGGALVAVAYATFPFWRVAVKAK